jgi:hypothetical protein
MAKKCRGVREDTGDKCNRSASSDSDYCFMHQSQESNQRLQYLDEDVYYCPQDGEKLLYVPKKDCHRCKECRGLLFSAKKIDSDHLRKISQTNQIEHEEKCCSCLEGADLSIHEVEYRYDASSSMWITSWRYEVSRIWNCNNCGSVWVEYNKNIQVHGIGRYFDWILELKRGSSIWLEDQAILREKRLEFEVEKERKRAKLGLKLCNHVDDSGEKCNKPKSQKSNHDWDFCWKHQPK